MFRSKSEGRDAEVQLTPQPKLNSNDEGEVKEILFRLPCFSER